MRVCYGIQDPIANPSAVLLQSIIDEAQECTYSLPTNHPYNTPTFQSILASGTDPLLSFVPGQAATVTSDEHGDETICIVKKCVTEAVIRQVREAANGYYSFYIAVLVFYLLTLAEGIDVIKDISTAWYVRLRLVLGVFALGEVGAFVIALRLHQCQQFLPERPRLQQPSRQDVQRPDHRLHGGALRGDPRLHGLLCPGTMQP